MTHIERYRYRIKFEKSESIRFISHLDLHRTWERTLRRAGLPLYHSQGFNPRPKINLSRALPLGQTSECELMDIWLVEDIEAADVLRGLSEAAAPGLKLQGVERVSLSESSLQSQITSAKYLVTLPEALDRNQVQSRIDQLLQADQILRERRKKTYDLRPLIESLSIADVSVENVTLEMQLAAREGASGRPGEVLLEMGIDPEQARIHRTRLFFEPELSR
mgnify:CR=1 FL=1